MTLIVKKIEAGAVAPTLAFQNDLAYDLYALQDTWVYQHPSTIRTGISCAAFIDLWDHTFPMGLVIKDRSSMASKGLYTHGGVIDPGYRGEILVIMTSHYPAPYFIRAGDKIAQMIPVMVLTGAVQEVDELPGAERGERGFGSSGK